VVCYPTPALGRVAASTTHLGRQKTARMTGRKVARIRPLRSAAGRAARSRFTDARARNYGHEESGYLRRPWRSKRTGIRTSATIHHSRHQPVGWLYRQHGLPVAGVCSAL